jgi:hypothetical protein
MNLTLSVLALFEGAQKAAESDMPRTSTTAAMNAKLSAAVVNETAQKYKQSCVRFIASPGCRAALER